MIQPSGYAPCACRDCFELTLAPGTMCHHCDDAGCNPRRECQAAGAYGGEPEPESHDYGDPARELPRLVAALSPAARAVLEPVLATIPADARADRSHAFWETDAAVAILAALLGEGP